MRGWRVTAERVLFSAGGYVKKSLLIGLTGILIGTTGTWALADPVRDWRDLEKVHAHVMEAIHEMERARAANHYDMAGHGAKAEELLRQAERELHESVQAARAAP
jgi:hypothetical protein